VVEIVDSANHVRISRRTIAITPVLLIFGIIAQVILLAGAVVLYVPFLIWPGILDGPYLWITRGMARIMTRALLSGNKKRESKTEMVPLALPFRDTTRPPRCLRAGESPW
jgi:hypothetical protein